MQDAPFAGKAVIVYAAGLVKGAFKTTGLPPQELDMVNVPVAGALIKVMVPLTPYCCVAESHAVVVAEIAEMLHTSGQGAGAV